MARLTILIALLLASCATQPTVECPSVNAHQFYIGETQYVAFDLPNLTAFWERATLTARGLCGDV
jgi:hypothetical protein